MRVTDTMGVRTPVIMIVMVMSMLMRVVVT